MNTLTQYVMRHLNLPQDEANALRREYWMRYGATLLGLTRRHGVDPRHFLEETTGFPISNACWTSTAACAMMRALPGRRCWSPMPAALRRRVLDLLGIVPHLHGIETIRSMRFVPQAGTLLVARLLMRHGARDTASSWWRTTWTTCAPPNASD